MLLDNKKTAKIGDTLKTSLNTSSKLSIVSGLFSIYAFEALKKELSKTSSARLLLTQWGFHDNAVDTKIEPQLNGDKFELRLRNQLNQAKVAAECAKWFEKQALVKTTVRSGLIPQTLFHVSNESDESIAIQGSSQFTSTGLGYTESDSFDMNMCVKDLENTKGLLQWFDSLWINETMVADAKELLLQQLNYLAEEKPAKFIYFVTLYNLFKDYLEEFDEEKIIKSKTGFKNTLVWNKLYKFQRDGVIGAIDKLETHNGCIIADSVGLGKTFEALAIIKYYELRNDRVLVLCPKKLRDNWTLYTINDKRNLLAADRFNYDVLNHTDLSRTSGLSGEINLATLNWGNYDLIVIDESHNFRNNNPTKDTKTRYRRLMEDIVQSGVKTKVLMLSATPVNNRMNDLKNQVAFMTEARDDAFSVFNISSVDKTLRLAQKQFNQWSKQPVEMRTVESLLDTMSFDYFKLLDLVTIARSRKHIEKYYGTEDIGQFPTRLPPVNVKADIDIQSDYPPLKEVNRDIRRLHLAAYSPLKYVRADKQEEYSRKYDMEVGGGKGKFKQLDREASLIHLMRVNLLKRMESSIYSFGLTVNKLLNQVDDLLDKIHNHTTQEIDEVSVEEAELDSPELADLVAGNKTKVLIQDTDQVLWKQDLEEDKALLEKLLVDANRIDAGRDAKLKSLKETISAKVHQPINQDNNKVIVFTAFADTAMYLYQHIATWAKDELGLFSTIITGGGGNKTNLTGIGSDFNNLLTAFSPRSKERNKIDPEATHEIDILIATDCISEGQNLQDCDTLINYDIHWNPVRIIQRFGRIDRLGSTNTQIQLINFWPNMELDEYINLEARVSGRMVLLDISATGEENVIDENSQEMNDLEYRRKQLQQLQEAVVDLEEMAGGISITDLTLNDFRMNLLDYLKSNPGALEQAPLGLFSVVTLDEDSSNDGISPGVIFCLRNIQTGSKAVPVDENYPLAPHFLVYVGDDGLVPLNFTQSKKILDLLKQQAFQQDAVDTSAFQLFYQDTNSGADMGRYQELLATAIDSIVGKSEEKGTQSLFTRGGTVLTPTSSQEIDDFEVVSYLILLDGSHTSSEAGVRT
ncbi:MAG: DEAD/DEAH box helicase family protein [Candidatus Thiodiazotropha sp. (ex. Lucinisca nassula)]|nr:DEAD/DEAH box helicase family protein [Candidatus Thiodiazotropha sp. (ex. Lucinisca nassula)]